MEAFNEAERKHHEFETARDAAIGEVDRQISELQVRRRTILGWGKKPEKTESKKRGRPRKEDKPALQSSASVVR
jgi:hypothetical protein